VTAALVRVPVYSIAKVFTAAAALRTFDDIGTRIEGFRLDDLLAHRSGLGDYASWPEYAEAVAAHEQAWPDDEVLARVEVGEPGRFRYSNPGYLLVRRALEAAHGAPFLEVLQRVVLDEVGIDAEPFDGLPGYDPRWVYPGTFVAEPRQVADGLAALLRTDTGRAMLHTQPVDAPGHVLARPGYGLGLMTDGDPAVLAGHGGGGPGFTLFALARADGSAAHVEVVPDEVDDQPLVRACLAALG
jgi:D-alanyl-D-alanine carboxypeptidase